MIKFKEVTSIKWYEKIIPFLLSLGIIYLIYKFVNHIPLKVALIGTFGIIITFTRIGKIGIGIRFKKKYNE